jgi:alpha-mannosidase
LRGALTPLDNDDVSGSGDVSSLPNQEASLLEISAPGVTLLTWKLAEDGDGTILRIQESAGKSSDVNIRNEFLAFEQAWLSNALEDNQSQLSIADELSAFRSNPFR